MPKPASSAAPLARRREERIALSTRPLAPELEARRCVQSKVQVLTGDDTGLWSRGAASPNDFSSGRSGRRKSSPGFTLVEVLIVMAIVITIAAMAVPNLMAAIDAARIARAVGDIRALETDILAYEALTGSLPDTLADIGRGDMLDPWGTPYQYLNFANAKGTGQMRKDRFLVPLNSTFDLYSMGKDRRSVPPITASVSHDDIIRASDGAYIGLASQY